MTPATRLLTAISLFCALGIPDARAASYLLPPSADNWLEEADTNQNHGTDGTLRADNFPGSRKLPILQFDLSSIGVSETITSAELYLNVEQEDGTGAPIRVFHLTRAWTESGTTWNKIGSRVDSTTTWGSFTTASPGSVLVDVTTLVQSWHGGVSNDGLVLVPTSLGAVSRYYSREFGTASVHPRLVITTSAVLGIADIRVAKAVSNGNPAESDSVTFTIDVRNDGPGPATSVAIQDPLPPGLTYVTNGQTQGSYDPGPGTWSVGGLTAGASAQLNLVAEVDPGTAGQKITNWAWFDDTGGIDSNSANDSDSATVNVSSPTSADLGLALGTSNATPSAGQAVMLTYDLENFGPLTANNIVVSVPDPAGLNLGLSLADLGTYSGPAAQWTLSSLPSGGRAQLRVSASVDLGTDGDTLLVQTSILSSDETDPVAGNDSASTTLIIQSADLVVTTSADNPNPVQGGTIVLDLVLANAGPTGTTGASATGPLPAGITYGSHTTTNGVYDEPSGVWSLGAMAAGRTDTLRITATVDSGTVGNVMSFAGAVTASDVPDPTPANNTDSVDVTVQNADLSIVKSVDDPTPGEGQAVTYTLDVTNNGPNDADNIFVEDSLPVGVTFFSSVPSQGTYSPGIGTWDLGALTASASASLDIIATVDAGTGGFSIDNTAFVVSSTPGDTSAANDTSTVSINIAGADLRVTKTPSFPIPNEGDTVIYTIVVQNDGPTDAGSVVVNDLLPAGITYQSGTPSQGSYDNVTGVWSVGSVNNGGNATLAILTKVAPGTAGTVITNTASSGGSDLPDPNPANDSQSALITVQAADLSLRKVVNNSSPLVGATITYSVDVMNAGPDSATSVIVTDVLPVGVTYQTSTPERGTYDNATGLWTVGTIAAADTASLSLVATVDAGTNGQTLWNHAAITAVDQTDLSPGNESDSASVAVGLTVPIDRADLVVDVNPDVPTPSEGGTVHYTISLTNDGPDPATSVTLTDVLPAGVSFVAKTASRGTFAPGTGIWTVGTMANAELATLDLEVLVEAGTAGQTITNTAGVSSSSVFDPDTGNSSKSVDIVVRNADLGLALIVDQATPNEGDPVQFTLTLHNSGPDAAAAVAVTSLLPTGLTYSSDLPSRGSYVDASGVWSVGALAVNDTVSLVITASVDAATGGQTITHPALITASSEGDSQTADNSTNAAIVVQLADLAISKIVNNPTPNEGDVITFTVSVSNLGPAPATGVAVTDQLPAGLTWQADVPSQGSYDNITGVWTVGALSNGGSASLDVQAKVAPGTNGTSIWNTATVTASAVADTNSTNDADSARVDVPLITGIAMTLVQSSKTANPGATNIGFSSLVIANSAPTTTALNSVAFDNVTVGPGSQTELDNEFGLMTLYRDDGDFTFEPFRDTPMAQAKFSGGRLVFSGLSEPIPSGAILGLHVGGSISLVARSGDLLDSEIGGPSDVQFDQSVTFVSGWPLAAAGGITVQGMASGEIAVSPIVSGDLTAGGDVAVAFDAVLPANGYAADTLNELRLSNLGDAQAGTDYTLAIWADGGDGLLDEGAGDDIALGSPVGLGANWTLTGLTVPISTSGLHVFAAVRATGGATLSRTIQLVIPGSGNGVVTVGGHDGPLDAATPASGTLTIQPPPTVMDATALAQVSSTLLPGENPVRVYALRIRNDGIISETLHSVTFTNRTVGGVGATQAQLDADWGSVTFSRDRSVDVSGTGRLAAGLFSGGTLRFGGMNEVIAPGDSARFLVSGSASLTARDGDQLDLSIDAANDLSFAQHVLWSSPFPLHPAGSFLVDGLVAQQIAVGTVDPSLLTGEQRRVSLDVVIPPNGYEDDTLLRFDVLNLGTAANGTDISRVEAWMDNGDNVFSEAFDTLLGELTFTGQRWERTGLTVPVPAPVGVRIFVTTDIADLATTGTTVQLAIPSAPDVGLGLTSNNDGPIDQAVASSPQVISTIDRVSISPVSLPSAITMPGASDQVVLDLAAENNYSVPKTLTALTLTNIASGPGTQAQLDAEFEQLTLWIDNGNGIFDGAPFDTSVGAAFFDGGEATFTGLAWTLPAESARHLWATANVSLSLASDEDVLGVEVASQAHASFSDATSVAASFPLDSGARLTIDGMGAAQIPNFGAPASTVGPNEGPVLALDFGVPANGYRQDSLSGLTLINLGTAVPSDLADVRLWRDGGDGAFDQGGVDDTDLGAFAFAAGQWFLPALTETLTPGATRFFVTVVAGGAPNDSATVRFAIPIDGVDVESNNDGPRDLSVVNPSSVLLSTSVLLAEIRITPSASTVDSTVTVTMNVRNLHPSAVIDSVIPSMLAPSGLGVLDPLTGPVPPMQSLGLGEEKVFTWTYRAASSGDIQLTGHASGVEAGGGGSHQSLTVTSGSHQIFVQAQDLNIFAVTSMPFSINRGQTGVVPFSLTFENPSGAGGSDIRLLGFQIQLEDEFGGVLAPASLLSRVVVNEGALVYLDKGALETTPVEMDLTLAQPVLIESSGSSSSATLGISLDVSDTTSVPNFRMAIVGATWFQAEDATSGGPVNVSLLNPLTFPISSGLARIVAEATQVDVAEVPASNFAVGQGQSDVPMLTITLNNPDPSGLAADARVTTFDVSLIDGAGAIIPDPGNWIDRIRVDGVSQNHLLRSLTVNDTSSLSLDLTTLISVPVNTAIPLTVSVDVAEISTLGAFQMRLADSALFDARDANTGSPLPVIYSIEPLTGPLVTVEAPANSVEAAGVPQIQAETAVGSVDVAALSVTLKHPGPASSGPIRVDALTLLCRDGAGAPLVPSTFLDRVRVDVDTLMTGLVTNIPGSGSEITVPISSVVIDPLEQVSLGVHFDVEVTAPATLFALQVTANGIAAVDGNLGVPVTVGASIGAEFPLTSGFTQFKTPARDLLVGYRESMPAVLAADGQTLEVMEITLTNPTEETGGDIRVSQFKLEAADRDLSPIDLGAAVASLQAWLGDVLWAETGPIDPAATTALLVSNDSLVIAASTTLNLRIEATLGTEPVESGLRIGFDADGVGVVQPGSSLLFVSVLPDEGLTFPFWTESGNFNGVTLKDSYSNFPNPFAAGREDTRLAFYLERAGVVSLKLYTLRGEGVRTLLEGQPLAAGLHQDTTWDGRNGRGDVVVNGVYLAEIAVKFDDGSSDRILRKVAVVR